MSASFADVIFSPHLITQITQYFLLIKSFFYKQNDNDRVWWVNTVDKVGLYLFTFDRKKIYNLFSDYPHNLSPEEKKIFDEENPYWKKFFRA